MVFIVNPASAMGKTKRAWSRLEPMALEKFPQCEVLFTTKKGHALELSRKAIKEQANAVIAVGGDGTISEVSGGFTNDTGRLFQKGKHITKLGIIAAGSGSDFVKTIALPKSHNEQLSVIQRGKTQTIDLGFASFVDYENQTKTRTFINNADVGIGAEVMNLLEKEGKKFGSWLSYQLATLRSLISYQNKELKLTISKSDTRQGIFNGVVVANAKYFGSGMKIAPDANLSDQLFDVILLKEMSKIEMIMKLPKLQKGSHIYEKEVEVVRTKSIKIESTNESKKAFIEFDGEPLGQCPVTFSIIPKAIDIFVP